nr:MAG TPA: hypothetical protein [Caudoviricetes sp.]
MNTINISPLPIIILPQVAVTQAKEERQLLIMEVTFMPFREIEVCRVSSF